MFKLAIKVCVETYFGLIHAMLFLLRSTKSVYFALGRPVRQVSRILWGAKDNDYPHSQYKKICNVKVVNNTKFHQNFF